MKALVQRVSEAGVKVISANYERAVKKGMVILVGIKNGDSEREAEFVADKCCSLRIFEDANQKMNLSIKDIDGEALVISQFTLYGDASRGNRPSFIEAARPEEANKLYEYFVSRMRLNLGADKIKTGLFGEMMEVKIINDGPVTLMVESK